MKYVFIINPAAGQKNSENGLLMQLKERRDFDYEIYYTKGPKDATLFVRNYCKNNADLECCFVACGGDGTNNEVMNGMLGAKNKCLAVWPCGSGNDYVKYYGNKEKFISVDSLLTGEVIDVDVLKMKDIYALNVISFGFDCQVIKTMEKVKRKPIIGGSNAYTTGVLSGLFSGRVNNCNIIADGELLNPERKYLLCTLANGGYVGGSFNCAPRCVIDDGLIEVCMVKTMSLLKMIPLISEYQKGQHLDDPKLKDKIVYRQAKKIELLDDEDFMINVDGELFTGKHFVIEIVPKCLKFVVPKE